MLKHGTTMDDAYEKIKELIEDTWKDMMELYLTPTEQPKLVTQTVVDFARTADYMYKKTDAFTFSHTLKDMIAKLFVEPILLF
jgi:beta-farnesene synthase